MKDKFQLVGTKIQEFSLPDSRGGELNIRALEGKDIEDVSEYLNPKSDNYKKMVDWISKDLGATTLRYQRIDDMVKAIGLPREKLCLYCWTGEDFQKN